MANTGHLSSWYKAVRRKPRRLNFHLRSRKDTSGSFISSVGMDMLKRRASIKGKMLNSAHEKAQPRMEAGAANEESREKTDAAPSY
jgi:hypothetical protein